MTDVSTTLPPLSLDGLAWKRQFVGDDTRPDWEWRHFDLVHAQAHMTIEDDAEFPALAKTLMNGTDESPRVVSDGNVIAGVLPSYARTGDVDQFELTCWRFAMLPHALITGRRRPSRTLASMWEAVAGGLNPTGPANLVDRSIAEFAREVRARLTTLAATLDPIEDTLIELRNSGELKDLGRRLGIVRREAIRLNRMLVPIVRAFDEDDDILPTWTGFSGHDVGHRLLHGALDDIAALHDRTRSLQDELTTRPAEEANRRLYIVSVVTTVLLPATFVTGFFGMNTGGMLWGGDEVPHGTVFATVLCAVAALVTLLWLHWKRML
jgi:zinc transporter